MLMGLLIVDGCTLTLARALTCGIGAATKASALWEAAFAGDVSGCEAALEGGCDLNYGLDDRPEAPTALLVIATCMHRPVSMKLLCRLQSGVVIDK